MVRTKIGVAILFSLSLAAGVEAQGVGSLIKKKVQEVTRAKDAPAPSQDAQQDGSKLGFKLTAAVMESFQRGLEIEIRMRQEFTSRLAGLKTPEQYADCKTEASQGPEVMKLMEEYATRAEKATTDADFQKLMVWMEERMNAITLQACGEDPQPAYAAQNDAFNKAREAGALEFAKAFQTNQPDLEQSQDPGQACPAASEEGTDVADSPFAGSTDCTRARRDTRLPGAQPGRPATGSMQDPSWWYQLLQEWCVPFFQLSAAAQQQAAQNGISIPGTGNNIFWVYTASEAALLAQFAPTLVPLLQSLS